MKIRSAQDIAVNTPVESFIDVRTQGEFGQVHIPGSQLLPLQNWEKEVICQKLKSGCVLVCQSGKRSMLAAQKLRDWGWESDAVVMEGGIEAWQAAGFEVKQGKSSLSLERQVRIFMGAIIAAGAILAANFSGHFIWVCGIMGAGLVVSGITNWCGIAMIIAKMPWNQGSTSKNQNSTCQR